MPLDDRYHWRDASRTPRFFIVDALAAIPLVLVFMHISWTTFWIAVSTTTFFVILERFKFTVPIFLRWLRCTLAGPIRIAYPWWRE